MLKIKNKFNLDTFLCFCLAFTLPITNFSIHIFGVRTEPQRILISLCIIKLIINLIIPYGQNKFRNKVIFTLFIPIFVAIAYALFLSVSLQPDFIKSIRFTTDLEIHEFIFKRAYKYISYILLAIYLGLVLKTESKIHTILCSLAAILCITEILGIIQSLVFLVSGFDLFPINRGSLAGSDIPHFTESVTVNFLGINFLRINSLAHEPKGLGILITFLFFMKLYWNNYRQDFSLPKVKYLDSYMSRTLVISILVLLLTFSGSALFSLFFGLLITIFSLSDVFKFNMKYLFYSITFAVFILFIFILFPSVSNSIDSFFQASILRRVRDFLVESSIESFYASADPEDGATLYNILNYPSVILSGLGFGAYSNVSLVYFSKYYPQGISPFSRNILIEIIFTVGLPGFILLSWFFYKINNFNFYKTYFKKLSYLSLMLKTIILINIFLRANEPIFFALIGILCASYTNYYYMYVNIKNQYHINSMYQHFPLSK